MCVCVCGEGAKRGRGGDARGKERRDLKVTGESEIERQKEGNERQRRIIRPIRFNEREKVGR